MNFHYEKWPPNIENMVYHRNIYKIKIEDININYKIVT